MADNDEAGAPSGVEAGRRAPPSRSPRAREPARAASPAGPDSGPVRIGRGEPLPLGLSDCCNGLNIVVFSRHATSMTLLLYETAGETEPSARIALDARRHRTGDIWHARVTKDLRGKLYALQAGGPRSPAGGHDFDPHRTLLDPYAASATDLSPTSHARCVVADLSFDWVDDAPLRHPWSETVLYETHVRGLTIDPTSGVRHPGVSRRRREDPLFSRARHHGAGADAGPGIQPGCGRAVQPPDGREAARLLGLQPRRPVRTDAGLRRRRGARRLVRELHRAGIEVILDVVFNHTAEGGKNGPTYSFRGLDNAIYYILTPDGGTRDGLDENHSDNSGAEGPTNDPQIEAMRLRQIKNQLVTLLISRGVPMLLGGDEFRRTLAGNNNAYCQDNALSLYDWLLAERNAGFVRFVQRLIALRKAHPVLRAETFYTDREVTWFSPAGHEPDWQGPDNRLGCLVRGSDTALCLLFNAAPARCRFVIPTPRGSGWQVEIDTSKQGTPADTSFGTGHGMTAAGEIWLEPRTTVVLSAAEA